MFRFPWGDMHSLNLGWFLQKFNELRAAWATAEENIAGALDAEIQRAEDALSDVFDARDAAAASATAAAGSASAAGTSATAAQNSATAAASSATLANNKATAAGLSEAAAAQSATQAGNSATAAAGSATAAGQSATNAAGSATAAGNSATAAAGSATAAGDSAAAAAESADEAAQSASVVTGLASILDSFPSRVTPLSKANSVSGSAATIGNGFVNFSLGVETTTVLPVYTSQLLPAGNYKLVIDLLELNGTGPTSRIGYIATRINTSQFSPIQNFYINSDIKKYELPFTLAEPSNVEIVAVISTAAGFSGSLKAFTYLDLSAPTATLGLALSN